MTQPDLIPNDRPTVRECSGVELENLLRELKQRGAFVWRMEAVGVSGWRVWVQWPLPAPGGPETSRFNTKEDGHVESRGARHAQG